MGCVDKKGAVPAGNPFPDIYIDMEGRGVFMRRSDGKYENSPEYVDNNACAVFHGDRLVIVQYMECGDKKPYIKELQELGRDPNKQPSEELLAFLIGLSLQDMTQLMLIYDRADLLNRVIRMANGNEPHALNARRRVNI
jgi:hypothetical protein